MNTVEQPMDMKRFNFNARCKNGFGSYWNQIYETLNNSESLENVLIIGQGDNVVPYILKSQGLDVETFDIVEDMNPNYLGDVREIDKIVQKKYNCILCCEVLEHIPFSDFGATLGKLASVCKNHIVLSLPVFGHSGYIKVSLPKIKFTFTASIPFNFRREKVMCDEHHWEINNSRQTSLSKINEILSADFNILKSYRVKDNPYHMFWVLQNKKETI